MVAKKIAGQHSVTGSSAGDATAEYVAGRPGTRTSRPAGEPSRAALAAELQRAPKAALRTAADRLAEAAAQAGAPVYEAVETEWDGPGAAKKTSAKTTTRKAAAKKTTAKKAVTEKAAKQTEQAAPAAGESTERRAPEKASGKKAPSGKAAGKKAPSRKAAGKKAPSRKAAGKKAAAKKTADGPGRRAAATSVAAGTQSTVDDTQSTVDEAPAAADDGVAEAAEQTGATTVVGKNTLGTAAAAQQPIAVPKARPSAGPEELAVRPGEEPWTQDEVDEARAELTAEALRLRNEIESSERSLAGLMRDSGDGAGDDQADTGTKNITREHELALAANAREMLVQTERALERLNAGTYGLCEICGKPIGKARMQAFPRATLCVEDKQKQERR
jgi:RNA polymerase-binding transcription factor DksA